jgi:hypothetical protein
MSKHPYYIFFLVVSYFFITQGAEQILSNPENTEESFSFSVGPHAFYIPEGRLFVGAQKKHRGNTFAVATADGSQKTFLGLTPLRVKLNNVTHQPNPLYEAAISHIALLGMRPLVLKRDDNHVYLIDFFMHESNPQHPIEVFASGPVNDAQGRPVASFLGVTTSAPALTDSDGAEGELAAFVAVSNQAKQFDGNGSGIALLFFKSEMRNNKKSKKHTKKSQTHPKHIEFFWDIVNAQTGAAEFILPEKPAETTENKESKASSDKIPKNEPSEEEPRRFSQKGNKAVPLGNTTPALTIAGKLSAIAPMVDLFYDRDLGRLYGALDVTAGENEQDGARALVVGQVVEGKLIFTSLAPDAAFVGNKHIVGGRGAHARIALHKVRTLQTRTHVRYLVVVGGNEGAGIITKRSVFALPLVDNMASTAHGKLASVRAEPMTLFHKEQAPFGFKMRLFAEEARESEDLYTVNSPQARVGGSQELPGDITDIAIAGDSVFASVGENGTVKAGIFYSQALFDTQGAISGWTNWQRVGGIAQKILGLAYDHDRGNFWYIPKKASPHTVHRTAWSNGETEFEKTISTLFKKEKRGIQGLFSFPVDTEAFTKNRGSRLSLLVATGFNKILLVQTAHDTKQGFGPLAFDAHSLGKYKEGALQNFVSGVSALSIQGGVLKTLGPITSAAVVSDGISGWLVVGGAGGVAVLTHNNGAGWDASVGLQSGFHGLTSGMTFKLLGSYSNVRKLISDGNILYILTPTTFERIVITSHATMVCQESSSVVLARAGQELLTKVSSFSDVVVSGPLALLATSEGLLRSGNGVTIQNATDAKEIQWKEVELPESIGSVHMQGPVSRLYAVTKTGRLRDLEKGGNVYALNAYVGTSQAQVYRLWVQVNQEVSDDSVRLLPDFFVKDSKTFFVDLGDYRNYFVTDGALMVVSRSAYGDSDALLELLPARLKSGQRFGARTSTQVPLLNKGDHARSIGQLVRESASGRWIVPGDFGVRINT